MKKTQVLFLLCLSLGIGEIHAQKGIIPEFEIQPNSLRLHRIARPGDPFDKVGRRFAILGHESGEFEAWAYPLKLLRNFNFSFYIGSSTRPLLARNIVRFIDVTPEATTLTYTFQSFTVKATFITPHDKAGAMILLAVDSSEPLSIVCGFIPVLQPMWPAGIGGQFAHWNSDLKAYLISESSGQNHAFVGSPAASGLSYTPAHMLSDSPNEFRIDIPKPEKIKGNFLPIYMAGGKGKRDTILELYQDLQSDPEALYRANRSHYKKLRDSTLQIKTPDRELDLAFEWAKVAFDNLIVKHPELGTGMVAGLGTSGTGGRPGFGWFFGGDTYINSMSLSGYGAFDTVRTMLDFTRQWQRADGKMAHELSQAEGYIDWWNDYPYGYIHGDTTPYYIVAVHEYVRWSGDVDFVRKNWDSLLRAYQWCLTTDANGDGLMDNRQAGLGALEYGALTGIATDIYLGAVWVKATHAMEQLARFAGYQNTLNNIQASGDHVRARQAFEKKFWDESNQFYAYAFNNEGDRVKEISPWNAVGLMWGLGTSDHSRISLERLSTAELTTDWGVRSISLHSRHFQSLNYNYGAVWPFLTSWVTTALYKHHMPLNAFPLLKATSGHTFNHGLGSITEVFSGTHHVWPQEAVSHQGFSSAAVTLPLIKGLLGLEPSAHSQTLDFAPHPPDHWKILHVSNISIGKARFSFDYHRDSDTIRIDITPQQAEEYTVRLAPALGIGCEITDVRMGSKTLRFETAVQNQVTQAKCDITVRDKPISITFSYRPTATILPFSLKSRIGEPNRGLKIVSLRKKEAEFYLDVEGLAGQSYAIHVLHPEQIDSITGGELEGDCIRVRIPGENSGIFVRHKVVIGKKTNK